MRKAIRAAFGLALFAFPLTAHADVLEVGEAGYTWVAGGPSASLSELAQPPAASIGSDGLGTSADAALSPQWITRPPDAAGPARWQARVAELAAKYDISPALLEAVVWQESRWNEGALSPAGARGLAQLMPVTAREMGVNPHDPTANLEGGARYLRMQLDAFDGDIEKALAAYNAGPARVRRVGGIPRIRETQAYVAAIMARLAEPVRQ